MLSLISKQHNQISSTDTKLVCKVFIAFDFLTSGIRALGIQMMQLTLNCKYFFLSRGLPYTMSQLIGVQVCNEVRLRTLFPYPTKLVHKGSLWGKRGQ